jgi:hypothetical protein
MSYKKNPMILSNIDKVNFHKHLNNPYKIFLIIDEVIHKNILSYTLTIDTENKKMYFVIKNSILKQINYMYVDFIWNKEVKKWDFKKGWYYTSKKTIRIQYLNFLRF